LVLLLGALQYGKYYGTRGAWFGLLFMVCLFGCVALHELGHSLVAQRLGLRVKEIVLLPIGGMARLSRGPNTPQHELLIALAGPLVNALLACVGVVVALVAFGPHAVLSEGFRDFHQLGPSFAGFLSGLILANVMLAVLNMLPALPMDGGRVARALLTIVWGGARATLVASIFGQFLAALVIVAAIYSEQIVFGILGALVFVAAYNERRVSRIRVALGRLTAREVVGSAQLTLAPDDAIGTALDRVLRGSQSHFAVLQGGRLVGTISRGQIVSAAASRGPSAFVAGSMHSEVARVDGELPLVEVHDRVSDADGGPAAVFQGEAFLGLLTHEDLWRVGTIVATLGVRASR
jgi:Zn-dependent protease/predicted transcriptional regulator